MVFNFPVGFRFHPKDHELVDYYLKHKLIGNDSMVSHVIGEVDICKHEPVELPGFSKIESDDQEWYFFCPCDYKYAKSKRFKRTTKEGFWKPTGKYRHRKKWGTNEIIGSKKTLVFYTGRGRGVKTNWVIHEYHAITFSENQRTFVLCRLIERPEEQDEGRNGTLTCDEGEPTSRYISSEYENQATVEEILDVVSTSREMNIEPSFEASSKIHQSFLYLTQQSLDQSCTNSPFLNAYFNKENNNMETIEEENETIRQEDEFVNSLLVGFDYGNGEKREDVCVNGHIPTQSESLTRFYNESTYMNAEVVSAPCGNTLEASIVPHEHHSTGAMHGSTSVLSSNKDKKESISQYDMMAMGTFSWDSTADKHLENNCNEIVSPPIYN